MAALTPPFYHFSPTRNTRSQGKYPWEAIPNPSLGDFEKTYNTNRYQHWFYCSFHLYKAACRQTAPFQPTLSLQELEEILTLQKGTGALPLDSEHHKTELL